VSELLEPGILTSNDHPLYRLGKQKLVMKGNETAFIT
jgi:hypothetical protein